MPTNILILGAGFGGLELSTLLTESLGDQVEITLIDRNEGFVFGFSKFELMFGRATLPEVIFNYRDIAKPEVTFRQETITAIDPATRHVTTDKGHYAPDVLVVALGADYDIAATPGLAEGGHEYYSVPGAIAVKDTLASFTSGNIVVGILGQPYKCPPAPSETVILLDEFYTERGVRGNIDITLVSQWPVPIPPSPEASKTIVEKFAQKNINFRTETTITSLDPDRSVAVTATGDTIPYDLFLAVPVHKVPDVVKSAGLSEDGWIPVSAKNLATRFENVYAIGDVNSVGTPKAGVFAESAARAVASHLIAEVTGSDANPFDGQGACYVELGDNLVGRVDANFRPGTQPTAPFAAPSLELAQEKKAFASTRRTRWLSP